MKKKILSLMFSIMANLVTMYAALCNGEGVCVTLYTDNTAAVSGHTEDLVSDITVPSVVIYENTTYTVTSIGQYAFLGCDSLVSVTLPNTITNIGYSAFRNCSSLTSINIPESVTSIGKEAFSNCSSLTSIILPDGITVIGDATFRKCENLSSIIIPTTVTNINEQAFWGCKKLTSIVIPEGVTRIGAEAFYGCIGLDSIVIPNSVTVISRQAFFSCGGNDMASITIGTNLSTIAYDAFKYCSPKNVIWNAKECNTWNFGDQVESFIFGEEVEVIPASLCSGMNKLTSINIPDKVTDIGQIAFSDCTNLTYISIGENVINIGESAFANCNSIKSIEWKSIECNTYIESLGSMSWTAQLFKSKLVENFSFGNKVKKTIPYLCKEMKRLTSVTIPQSVVDIEIGTFDGCSGLTSITIGDRVTCIGESAFQHCSRLIMVVIPNGVTTIGKNAFSECTGLTNVSIPNSITSINVGTFQNCASLASIIIPDSITYIGGDAFSGCSSLNSVEIPSSVTSIGSDAFDNCENLIFIKFLGSNPPTMSYPFDNTNDCPIYVPCDALEVYQYRLPTYYERITLSSDCSSSSVYTVTFKDWDSSVLKTEQVEEGHSATAPTDPTRDGYIFTGWDKDFSNVLSDLDIFATYQENTEGIDNVSFGDMVPSKIMIDGNVYILRGDKVYTLLGQKYK